MIESNKVELQLVYRNREWKHVDQLAKIRTNQFTASTASCSSLSTLCWKGRVSLLC